MNKYYLKFSLPLFLTISSIAFSMEADFRCTTQQKDVSYDARIIEGRLENIQDEQTLKLSFFRPGKPGSDKEHIADSYYSRDESYRPRTPTSKKFYKFNVGESDSFPDGPITPIFLDKEFFNDKTVTEGELKFAGIGHSWTRYECQKVTLDKKQENTLNNETKFTFRKSLTQPRTLNAWSFDLEVKRISPNSKLTPLKSLQIRVTQKDAPDRVLLFPEPLNIGTAFEKRSDEKISLTHKYSFTVALPRNMGSTEQQNLEVHVEAWDQACFGEQLDCAFLKVVGGHRTGLDTLTQK
jgi:hypothetical protein